jgi:hypothetical protein
MGVKPDSVLRYGSRFVFINATFNLIKVFSGSESKYEEMLRRLLTPSAKTVIGNNVNCPVRVYIGNVGLAYEDVDIVILCMPVFWIENSERWKRLINLKHMGM